MGKGDEPEDKVNKRGRKLGTIYFDRDEKPGCHPIETSVILHSDKDMIEFLKEMIGPRGGVISQQRFTLTSAEWNQISKAIDTERCRQ
jgi:hypothetical protein